MKWIAFYSYKKHGTSMIFEAEKHGQAVQMAIAYQKESNAGEAKSDRIRFLRCKEYHEKSECIQTAPQGLEEPTDRQNSWLT